jgi:hypothetical protein
VATIVISAAMTSTGVATGKAAHVDNNRWRWTKVDIFSLEWLGRSDGESNECGDDCKEDVEELHGDELNVEWRDEDKAFDGWAVMYLRPM